MTPPATAPPPPPTTPPPPAAAPPPRRPPKAANHMFIGNFRIRRTSPVPPERRGRRPSTFLDALRPGPFSSPALSFSPFFCYLLFARSDIRTRRNRMVPAPNPQSRIYTRCGTDYYFFFFFFRRPLLQKSPIITQRSPR